MVIREKKILSVIWPALALLLLPVTRSSAGFTVNNAAVSFNNNAEFRTSTITINAGGALNAGSSKISVSGNWENAGAFDAGTSIVAFEDGAIVSSIIGDTIFHSFVSETAGKTMKFASGSTQKVNGVFSVTGSPGNLIKLRSSEDAVKWSISFPNGPQTISYADIRDSDALLNTVTAINSLNSGNNNAKWAFGSIPAGCGAGLNVRKDGTGDYTSIQSAVDALVRDLTADTCVVIRDTETYSEQVTVQGFTNNGYRLKIMPDPTFVSSAPVVNPPESSIAAFQIMNDSVTVQGINIISTNAVSYGILASSASVFISNVNVDSGGMILGAGIQISSYSAVSYSSITVQAANGLQITGSNSQVSFSSMAGNNAANYALYIVDSDSNTVTRSYISNPAGHGARLGSGSDYNTISDSTISGNSGYSALYITNSDFNTVTRSYMSNPSGYGADLSGGADYNTVSYSTMTSNAAAYCALYVNDSSSNTVSNSYVQGYTAAHILYSTSTVIGGSMLVAADTAGYALRFAGGSVNLTLSSSTLTGGAQGAGIYLDENNSGFINLSSDTINGGKYGLNIAAQSAGASLDVSSITFQSLTAGATAVNFLGAVFVSTFSNINFADTSIAVNVNGSSLGAGSRLTMRDAFGPRYGNRYEKDPGSYVHWAVAAPIVARFTGVSTGSAGLAWEFPNPDEERPLMVISADPAFAVNISSVTGALGAQTTSYYGLTPNATYYFRGKMDGAPDSAYWAAVSTITDPGRPGNPRITGVYASSLTVSWSDGGNNPGSVYNARAAQDEAFEVDFVSTLTVNTSFIFEGLDLNSTYYILARTTGFSGVDSADADFGSTITLSARPVSPSYDAVYSSGALLSWDPNGNLPGTRYEVLVSSDDFLTLNYSSSTEEPGLAAYGLAPNTTYYFKTAALNSAGVRSGYAVFASTLTRANMPKLHPSGSFTDSASDTVVRWLPNSNPDNTEYFLHVSSSPDFLGLDFGPGTWSGWAALVSVTPLDAGVTFYFEVKARDALLRETAWLDLGFKKTLAGVDTIAPSVVDLQGGDDAWRGASGGLYKVHFYDLGSGLSKFSVKLAASQDPAGPPLADWTDVVTDINAQSYDTDWQLPASVFQTITEGVTAYASVRVYDRAPAPNIAEYANVFYVIRDTTPPNILNGAASPSGWQNADPGPFNIDFTDARSGLAFIQYSASGSPGAADAAVLGWTDIDALASSKTYTADWRVDFPALASGATNYISVRAIDAAGNVTTRADAFKILKMAGGPGVAFASPSAAYVSTVSALSGAASGGNDGITVSFVEVGLRELAGGKYYDGSAGSFSATAPVWLRAAGGQAWSLNVATFGFVNLSSYTASARATDSLGRYSLSYATVTFTLDQDPPTASLSSPAALSTVYALDAVTGAAGDALSGPALAGVSVKRNIDGKWWDFLSREWGTVQSSSLTAVSGGVWTFLPDVYLRGNMMSGYDYFVTAYAADAAAPANLSAFGLAGSTFTFTDIVPPERTVQVSASTDPASVLPGRLRVNWVFPGDDGGTGMLGVGEFAVKYATFTGFDYSTASAQVLISTASVSPGSAQVYILSGLANATSCYLRLWTKDDAGLWSAASPEFSGLSGESLLNEIAGHVRTSPGEGITGVLVEAFNAPGAAARSAYTVDDGSGSFSVSGLDAGVYRMQVTWIENGIASSVSKDGIPVGYADADFTLSVNYSLASISGQIPARQSGGGTARLPGGAAGAAQAAGRVELYQQGRRVAAADTGDAGTFTIANLLPGDYELRAPGMEPLAVRLRSGENLVVKPAAELLTEDSFYAYPDPAHTWVKFRFRSDEPAVKKELSVFNVAGLLIKRIRDGDPWTLTGGNLYEFRWDFSGSGPAPGIYFYKLNVKSQTTGKTRVKTGKFAVIR